MVRFGEQLQLELDESSPNAEAHELAQLRQMALIEARPLLADEDSEDDFGGTLTWDTQRRAAITQAIQQAVEHKNFGGRYAKLKPWHIQAIMLKASGLSSRDVAYQLGKGETVVCHILQSPAATTLLSTILSIQAEALPDIHARLKIHAHEALDRTVHIMRTAKDETSLKASFKVLEMAGYGAVKRVENTHELKMPAQQASQLIQTINQSDQVRRDDYVRFLESGHTHIGEIQVVDEQDIVEVKSA